MAKYITFILSAVGLAVGVWAVSTAKQEPPVVPLAREASVNPFSNGVAALGLVEPAGREVEVLPPEPGMVMEVFVQVGDRVEAGAPLFRLDTRRLEADLMRAQAAVATGKAEIARWEALPRAEDLPPLEAAVTRAEAIVRDRQDTLQRTQEALQRNALSERDLSAARFALEAAQAELVTAQANLARAKAGGWQPDLVVAQAALGVQEQEVAALKLLIDRLTVRAPRAGMVLRREVEPGEFITNETLRPAMILGDLSKLHIRAQVDEEDIALVGGSPRAVARTRGAAPVQVPLTLLRVEPYARPKTDLLGINTERVDTRVIDVVFEAGAPEGAVYPGMGVDVFIEAVARPAGGAPPAPSAGAGRTSAPRPS
ncbi:MAG TPA: HlyD family efflux transporter periplasmic adaptor subunit [Phycisphaerales bacterium]|nr:HlyD family efflux transporter periplasmic adaptor subunit [Phycisphaerales bacterium]